jgi:signal transduction histidine kinase
LNALILAAGFALVHYTRRSRQLAEAQMNFVANVSHELRTPLTVIRGAGHNLLRGIAREPQQIEQYSRLILEHTDQLTEMVEQVLGLSGAKKSQSAALRQPVALGEVLNDAINATAHDIRAAGCEIQVEFPPSLPSISADASALRRVFQNLISNAAKHASQGRWIGITAVADEDSQTPTVEIQVSDRGPGIPESELTHIFRPFFRGTAAQAQQTRGSGLGLSLVKEIVESHGGNISVVNNNGQGATFTIRLPVRETNR